MRYRVLIEQDEDGVYVAEVPAPPGCKEEGPASVCPTCGSNRIARIEWGCAAAIAHASEIRQGRVILGGQSVSREAPRWICLACNAGWLDVHRLAAQEGEFQTKLEAAVADGNFPVAAEMRDRRDELAKKRLGLLKVLQNECF